ncbi:acyltransferase family protein [Poseidonocella pacifica]|uniref:acyltransferase family protein n=1 Tax=Poseidonocella pacifica TaxID=871651 RepID=UPI000B89FA32|nr:acyltransferase family protein [Poseidonocella pacifica]
MNSSISARSSTPARRLEWIDATKGAMIILVVVGHTWRGLWGANLLSPNLFAAVDMRIYAFHMPVFFAVSGWFFLASLSRMSVAEFLQ